MNASTKKSTDDEDEVQLVMVVSPPSKRKHDNTKKETRADRKLSAAEQKSVSKKLKLKEEYPSKLGALSLDVWVAGRPKPKRRPNKSRIGAIYNASHKEEKEFKEKFTAGLSAKDSGFKPFPKTTPIRVELSFYYPKDKYTLHTTGDVDNLAKLVLDSIEGTAFVNDNQVVELIARKIRSNDDSEGTRVVIEAVSQDIGCSLVASKPK